MASSPPCEQLPSKAVRVMIVDDHAVVALGIAALLDGDDDIEVVARGSDVATAVTAARHHRPDVILMDFRLPDGTGLDAISQLRADGCDAAVIMLTAATDRRVLRLALEAGCLGFLSKNADHGDLVRAIRAAARNETSFTADMLTQLVHVGRVQPMTTEDLTARECDVLQLSADGLQPDEIAERMHLSQHTIRNHLRHAMTKLDAHTKLEAVVKALQANLISVDH
ncbi:MAG: response regulator transcription factor [Ilumatobacteraceae bacterium]